MKNLIIILVIAIGTGFTGHSEITTTKLAASPSLSVTPPDVKVTVNFGRASRGCRGLVICGISAEGSLAVGENGAQGVIKSLRDSEIILTLNKNSIPHESLSLNFANTQFTLEEDFKINPTIISSRDPASGQATGKAFVIRKGTYDVENKSSVLSITFSDIVISSY